MSYDNMLAEQFGDLEINIVRHDDSPTGYPCYIEVKLGKTPKDKGAMALDLGNYIYRLGLKFQCVPEYRGRGKAATIRWFMSWDDLGPLLSNVHAALGTSSGHAKHLPLEFRSLIIQNTSRGVRGQYREAV
jgi:hypothetical protein